MEFVVSVLLHTLIVSLAGYLLPIFDLNVSQIANRELRQTRGLETTVYSVPSLHEHHFSGGKVGM
jgi:hypothetical protein